MSLEPISFAFNYLDETQHDNAWRCPRVSDLRKAKFAERICIHTADENMEWIGGSDYVLDERHMIDIVFDYPLSKPATLTIHRHEPITVQTFVTAVEAMYRSIYNDEARTAKKREGLAPGTLNRNHTDGKYGVWGHGLSDLFLEQAEHKADGKWYLCIGS